MITRHDPDEVAHLVAALSDRRNAVPAASVPSDPVVAGQPGLYAWWVDDDGLQTLSGELSDPLAALIYAGLAGATPWPSGKQNTVTLRQRVLSLHLRGTIKGSTFRLSLAAILRRPLALHVIEPQRLAPESEHRPHHWDTLFFPSHQLTLAKSS